MCKNMKAKENIQEMDNISKHITLLQEQVYDTQRDVSILQICLLISSCLNVIVLAARIMGY